MTSHEHWTRPETERWQIEKLHECMTNVCECKASRTEYGRIVWHANKPAQTLNQCLYYASSHRYIMDTQHLYRLRCIDTGEIIPMCILVQESWEGIG